MTKYTKTFQRAKDARHITLILSEFSWHHGDLADELGVSTGAVSKWERDGNPPAWTVLAVECLRRRHGNDGGGEQLIFALVPSEHKELVAMQFKSLNIPFKTFDQKDF